MHMRDPKMFYFLFILISWSHELDISQKLISVIYLAIVLASFQIVPQKATKSPYNTQITWKTLILICFYSPTLLMICSLLFVLRMCPKFFIFLSKRPHPVVAPFPSVFFSVWLCWLFGGHTLFSQCGIVLSICKWFVSQWQCIWFSWSL